MEAEFNNIDTESLETLYNKRFNDLQTKLLTGLTWEDVQEDRGYVVRISQELHRRSFPLTSAFNPAEVLPKWDSGRP